MSASVEELASMFNERFAPVPEPAAGPAPAQTPATVAAPESPVTDAATAPAADATPATGISQIVDHAKRGVHLDVTVTPAQIVDAARLLDAQGFGMDTITGVDWIAMGRMEVVYDFFHPQNTTRVAVRVHVPRDQPEVPTISQVFPGANWHERETHDFFGIVFAGHPDLSPILLPEDADYHPLKKDFAGDPH